MADYPIDLAKTMDSPSLAASPTSKEPYYPTLHLEWDESYDLPDSGTMTVKFKKVNESNSKGKNGSHQSVSLDITSIEDVEPDDSADTEETPGDALDRLKNEVESSKEDTAENGVEE